MRSQQSGGNTKPSVASRGSSHVLDPTAPTRRSALFGGREARPVTATALSIWHTWRLTSGERVLALPGGKPSAAPGRATHHTGPESLVASSFPEQDPDPAARHAGGPTAEPRPAPERTELPGSRTWTEGRATVRACLVGGALVALGVGVIALLATVARLPVPAPPAVAPPPPAA
jgi:hypothetical protein